jgi:uroporphyrin-III C-methyltransferase / precorrin-2 dehydrogenase / sirohydrochlorin ferrochelatase
VVFPFGKELPVDLYPVFLRLSGRPVLIVGGGNVASAKIESLLAAGATVTVVSPRIADALRRPGVRLLEREFVPADLDGHWFVVAAAPAQVNAAVARAAEERRIFVNAVDDTDAASAWLGGVLRRGDVTLAISTDGRAPALAGLLREALEALVPEEIESWAEVAHELRKHWKADGVAISRRRPLLLRALNELYREAA